MVAHFKPVMWQSSFARTPIRESRNIWPLRACPSYFYPQANQGIQDYLAIACSPLFCPSRCPQPLVDASSPWETRLETSDLHKRHSLSSGFGDLVMTVDSKCPYCMLCSGFTGTSPGPGLWLASQACSRCLSNRERRNGIHQQPDPCSRMPSGHQAGM